MKISIKFFGGCNALALLLIPFPALSQSKFIPWNLTAITSGNQEVANGYGIGNDFKVSKPIIISSLGVFDDQGDGIKGQATLIVHLYASNPSRARKNDSGVLLETVVFDAADSGKLIGSFRYKPLLRP